MLVDDKQAREKMAKICDLLAEIMESGAGELEPGGRLRQAARNIRQTDLSDCKVEESDKRDRLEIIADLVEERKKTYDLSAQVAELKTQYHELLYGVARKFPGETRHQTALRYINNAETASVNSGCAAAKESGNDPS